MSNIIPPLLSNSPPPPPTPDEDDDDEFGDFTGHNDCSYSCDNLSLPSTPEHSPTKLSILCGLDINFNGDSGIIPCEDSKLDPEKDFQDKRKYDSDLYVCTPTLDINSSVQKNDVINNFNNLDSKKDMQQSLNDSNINSSESEDENTFPKRINLENCTKNGMKEKQNQLSSIKSDEIGEISLLAENEISSELTVIPTDVPIDSNEYSKFSENVDEIKIENNDVKLTILEQLNPPTFTGVQVQKLSKTDDMPAIADDAECADHVDLGVNNDLIKNNEDSNIYLDSETRHLENSEFYENFDFIVPENCYTDNITSNENLENVEDGYSIGNFVCTNVENPHISGEDEFSEFANFNAEGNSTEYVEDNFTNCDNNSDDFGDFTSSTFDSPQPIREPEDFGNFASFSEPQKPVLLLLDETEAFDKANDIMKEMFPCYEDVQDDFEHFVYEKDNFIFNKLQDITDTPALSYQWSKSASQKMLLMSLNIDARNILYGPSWNPSMPRFAANLSLEPLEPVKTECLSPSVQKSSPSQSASLQQPSTDIPNVQFDWNSSGLTNPLDYSQTMLLDLEQLVASLDLISCNPKTKSNNTPTSPNKELEDWDIWLKSVSKNSSKEPLETSSNPLTTGISSVTSSVLETELEPKKVPSKTDLEEAVDDFDEFHDFTSFQKSAVSPVTPDWSNTVPLRETYISNDNIHVNHIPKDLSLDVESWLQPTIVTPELPRKQSISQDEELSNICTPKSPSEEIISTIDDDFDDFQMVLPKSKTDVEKDLTKSDILSPMKTLENKVMTNNSEVNFRSQDFIGNLEGNIVPPNIKPVTNITNTPETKLSDIDDDEFTDFHFSAPVETSNPQKQVTTILEPLKPTPIYPSSTTIPLRQINWPDPGITEEELKKFDDVFSRPLRINNDTKNIEEPKPTASVPIKNNIPEDDEWTEFVSVQKPSPIHKVKLNEHERTASPDLPLSVFNLGSIQPTKQPIPVITPQGIFQTKLSTNPAKTSPKASIKSNVISPKPMYQIAPSIISHQYASHAYSFSNNHTNQKNYDDVEWGEFVSSPLPAHSISNGYQKTLHNNSSQHYSFDNSSPNIIMNPGHFVQNGSNEMKVPSVSVNKKTTTSNLVLPELDFIAPNARTSTTRKK